MIEATLTLAALIPLAGFAGWRVGGRRVRSRLVRAHAIELDRVSYRKWKEGYNKGRDTMRNSQAERPNADDYRNRAERAEAALAEALAELAKYKLPRNAKGQFVSREP